MADAVSDALDTVTGLAQAKGITLTPRVPEDLPPACADPDESGFLRVDVTDEGRGIRQDGVDKLFDRLDQAQGADGSSRKGLGLGLHICRELVTGHGGTIRVESTPGKGSVFSFTLRMFAAE